VVAGGGNTLLLQLPGGAQAPTTPGEPLLNRPAVQAQAAGATEPPRAPRAPERPSREGSR